MIDMGMHHGEHVFFVGNKSYGELIQEGLILAIPDPERGIIFKRATRCTEVEKLAAFTLEEAAAFIEKWNKEMDNHND